MYSGVPVNVKDRRQNTRPGAERELYRMEHTAVDRREKPTKLISASKV